MSRELTSQTVLSLSDEVIKPFFAVEMNFGGGTISVTAGSFVIGETYTIGSVGTTDFTLVGSADNDVGTSFVATGVGVGDGLVGCSWRRPLRCWRCRCWWCIGARPRPFSTPPT